MRKRRVGMIGREGRERSVEEEKAWLNQPESRVGRSPMRVVVDGEGGEQWPMSAMGRSDHVRGRWLGFVAVGAGTGSSIESDV
jgi:hypothetical protein